MLGIGRINRTLTGLVRDWRMALGKQELALLREYPEIWERFHVWYYYSGLPLKTKFLGRTTIKSAGDLWNYQEILWDLKARLVIEFGTAHGGSALYFRTVLAQLTDHYRVLSVDVDHSNVDGGIRADPHIELLTCSSTEPRVAQRIAELRLEYPGPAFFILDSDHAADHVLEELRSIRPVTRTGDYVVVEDGNVNGHPVTPAFGPGPYEAVEAYFAEFPGDYAKDAERERKFGFTFAPNGFLRRA